MPDRESDWPPELDRTELLEVLAIVGAVGHMLRFTKPPRQDRANEVIQHLIEVGTAASFEAEDVLPVYRAWFRELALYFGDGLDVPEGDEHFTSAETTYQQAYGLGDIPYADK